MERQCIAVTKESCPGNLCAIINMGIHVAANSKYKTVSDLEDTKVAIVKDLVLNGVAYNADNHSWKTDNLQFEIVNLTELSKLLQ
jgi:hypothetical protein